MAKGDGQTLEKLYIELGLDLSQLQADILAADKTVTENLGRLNREKNTIRLRMEADIAGLDKVKDATKIIEIQERALNQELTLSRDKLAILEAAHKQVANNANSTSMAVQKAEQAFLKEKIAVGQLEQELKALSSQRVTPAPSNILLSGYQGLKGKVADNLNQLSTAFNDITKATQSADSAITKTLEIIGTMPTPVGKAVAALVSMPLVFKGIENSILSMTKVAASVGDSVYVTSRGFQMSIADTAKFTTMCKVAGVEVNDLSSTIKRMQQQIVRVGENSKGEQWLNRYGESAFDASGHLKDLNEMALSLSRGLKKAQVEGNGMAFVLGTIRSASADTITALEDLEGNYELAAKIVKNGLANPALAHEVQGNLNALNVQAGQLNASFNGALLPVANEIIPKVTERMGKMTTLIKDNKDIILSLGRDFAKVWGSAEEKIDKITEGFSFLATLGRENRVVRQTSTRDVIEKYKDDVTVLTAEDLLQAEIENGGYTAKDRVKISARTDLYKKELSLAEEELKDLIKTRREEFAEKYKSILEKYKSDEDIKTMTDLLNKLTEAEKDLITQDTSPFFRSLQEKVGVLNLELKKLSETTADVKKELKELLKQPLSGANSSVIGQERKTLEQNETLIDNLREARKYRENAQSLIDKLNLTDYQKQQYDLHKWLQEQLPREEEQPLEKYQAVMEEYNARSLQIEQERADRLAAIRQQIRESERTEIENRMLAIESEKEAWIQAGMEELEAEKLSEQQKAYYIKGIEKELSATIEGLHQTSLEKRLAQIEREKESWINKGASEVQAEKLAQEQIRQAHEESESRLNDIRESVAALDRSELENKLANIEREKKSWIELGMTKAEAESLARRKIQKEINEASEKEREEVAKATDARAKAEEQYAQKVKAVQEEVRRKNEEIRNEAWNVLEQESEAFGAYLKGGQEALQKVLYKQLIKSGVNPKQLEQMTPVNLLEYKQAENKIMKGFLPNWYNPYEAGMPDKAHEPRQSSEVEVKMPDIVVEMPESAEEATRGAIEALKEIPNVVQGLSETLTPQDRELVNPFDELEPVIESVTQQFISMGAGFEEVTVKINDLYMAMENFLSQGLNSRSEEQRQAIDVNTTIEISEAHAWDYDHIEELAERVAAIIEPTIINAVGGDSNSY